MKRNKMLKLNSVYCGDCVKTMKYIDNESIDLVITSPPYDNLRAYHQYSFDFENTAKELFRIMKCGGVIVWVVGDATIKGSETGTSFKQALYFKKIGFKLHDTMIYKKNNYIPLNHNRYDQCFEYMFIFSKKSAKTFNPIMVKCKTAGKSYNYKTRNSASSKEKRSSLRNRDEIKVTKSYKYSCNIWGYNVGKNKGSKDDIWQHPATFPDQLAEDHIMTWSNKDDIVLDPMCGSGTVCKMAKINKRNFIGIDCSKEYCKMSCDRLNLDNYNVISTSSSNG